MATSQLDVLTTLALRGVLDELLPDYQKRTGLLVRYKYDATQALDQRIRDGARADVALLTASAITGLEKEQILAAGCRVDLVRSDIGVGVRQGAPSPSIDTVEQFKAALLQARSIAYSKVGASGLYFKGLIERLGIAEQVNAKATVVAFGPAGEPVARGEIEMAIQQISELAQVPGLTIVGRLPHEIQQTTVFSAGLFAQSQNSEQAKALMAFLGSPQVAPVLKRHGFEPVNDGA